jgi:hypothetical protein
MAAVAAAATTPVSGVKRRREEGPTVINSDPRTDDNSDSDDDDDNDVIGMVDDMPTIDDLVRLLRPNGILLRNNDDDDDQSETGQSLVVHIDRESESKTRTKSGRSVRVNHPSVCYTFFFPPLLVLWLMMFFEI